MLKANKKALTVFLSLLMLTVFVSASFAWETVSEVRRLNKEAPSLDGFAGAGALIWLRNNDFRMLTDGTMENTRRVIVMMGEKIPAGEHADADDRFVDPSFLIRLAPKSCCLGRRHAGVEIL